MQWNCATKAAHGARGEIVQFYAGKGFSTHPIIRIL